MSASNYEQQIAAFSDLAMEKTWSQRDTRLEKMEALYSRIDKGSKAGIILCFALAKVYDDLDEVEHCFALLKEGNEYHSKGKVDTLADATATIAAVRDLFSGSDIRPSPRPIPFQPVFILGMPRSGTSLVEQILASHSRVWGGGELKMMSQWCAGFLKMRAADEQLQLNEFYLNDLQNHYVRGLQDMEVRPVLTDKLPQNFLWAGFILTAFPNAKIIHTVRDPMAVCWSIYKTDFAGRSHGYACDLADIGRFYRLYAELMDFWREQFPDRIYDLDYERLTREQESQTRALLQQCGLDWEDACLQFHLNSRPVQTASREQVKRPMYQNSSVAWKRYEMYLAPLKQALGSLAGP